MKKVSFLIIALLSFFTLFSGYANAEEVKYIGYTEYLGYTNDHVFYVQPTGEYSPTEKRLVYCFDLIKGSPAIFSEDSPSTYTKNLADGTTLSTLTSGSNKLKGTELEKAVTNVIYNGFGINALDLKEKYQMTDFQFNQVTQQAVWFYTEGRPASYVPSKLKELGNSENLVKVYKILIGQDATVNLKDAPTELKLNIYKADDSYYQNLLGTSFINPTTGEVVLKGDKVPNPSKPEETTPSEETTTETMEVPTTEKNNLPNTGSQTVNVQPTTVVTPTTVANKPEVVKSTNQAMLPKTGTQSKVSVTVLGLDILGLAFLGLKRQRKMK